MISDEKELKKYYQMLLDKNSNYEGIFFVGVKTTGIFCRPTCPAKKPYEENCEFFHTAQEALLAAYRPCKRCNPLSAYVGLSDDVKKLVDAVEGSPEKKWKDYDFDLLGITSSTARRQFKKHFGMTFIEYARARRLGLAFDHIRNGEPIINAQIESSYDSGNGFRDAFSKIMGTVPSNANELKRLYSTWVETLLGSMLIISDDESIYLLEFTDRCGLETEIATLRKKYHAVILPERKPVMDLLETELQQYFSGQNITFTTPIHTGGSDFQRNVWKELRKIPLGKTIAYKELAEKIGNPKASRAVARANGANTLSIIIPCHRVINSSGELGGYGGGIARKQWLLKHEKAMIEGQ